MVTLKREQQKKKKKNDDKKLAIEIVCNYLLHNLFLENVKTWVGKTTLNGRKWGIAFGDKKKNKKKNKKKQNATPTNEDLGQTSNWSKLVAAWVHWMPDLRS